MSRARCYYLRTGLTICFLDANFRRRNLLKFRLDGEPIFLSSNAHEKVLHELIRTPTPDLALTLQKAKDRILITDDNMQTEYELYPLVKGEWTWASLIQRLQ